MTSIKVYEHSGKSQGETSQAFAAKIVKELMRGYSLDFSVVNSNNVRQFLVPGCVTEAKGQKFDMSSFKQSSGSTNKTDVSGRHVSCRLTNYLIPIGYAFIGTAAQIAQDILNVATDKNGNKANTEFYVGTCSNVSGSFSLGNTQISTARAALFAMKSFGVEVDFDNFIINLPSKCGTGKTKTFEFGKDLVSLERTWDDSNGTSYTAKIADLQRIPGHEADAFDVGDDCIIKDKFIGDVIQKRIISYTQCLDDPTQDEITIGVFVRDSADQSIAMQVDISAAQAKADGSVQVGESYNNVDISHEYGFRSTSADGLMRTFQNGTDGYLIQHNVNGAWVTVWQVTSADGTTTAYSADGNQAVMLGGTAGMRMFKKDSNENWQLVGGMDADGNSMASKIFSPDYPDFYAVVGSNGTSSDGLGLFLYDKRASETKPFCEIWYSVEGHTIIQKTQAGDLMFVGADGKSIGVNDTLKIGNSTFTVKNGLVSDWHTQTIDGDLPLKCQDGYADITLHVKDSVITGWN